MQKTWIQLEQLQPIALTMMKNSILKNRVSHAYLFEGMRGTGKRETGMLLAKSLLCEAPIDGYQPCEHCVNCKRINNGNHPDVHIVEPDGLSIKKQQIRELQEEFSKKAVESTRKIYIIVHADKMSVSASNSLLKFLEEPSSQTVAFLLTEQIQQILPTILSRCQVLSFKQLIPNIMAKQLVENGVNPENALLLAHLTNNPEEAIALNVDDWFAQAQKIVLKLYEVLKKNSLDAMVSFKVNGISTLRKKSRLIAV